MKKIAAVIFSLIITSGPSLAQSDIVGAFGIELGSEMPPSADGGLSLRGYRTTSFDGSDSSGIFSSFFAAVTPTTQRVAAIVGMSDGARNEQWCQSTAEQLSRTLSKKYGDPLDNIISIEAFRRGDLYVWRRDGKEISLACRAYGMMGPFYVQAFYTDAALMDDFVSENLTIENGEINLDDMQAHAPMREIDCSMDVAELIKKMIDDRILLIPGSISLEQIKIRTGYANNLIGQSFPLIEKILLENGYSCKKCGTPKIIQISKKLYPESPKTRDLKG